MTILTIIIFILVLGGIIFVHELGHFTFAKITGVYVYEFSLGMGPKLFSKKGKETEYCLRLIPIGGFCAMAGEEVDEEQIKVPKKRRLQAKSCFQRFLIMFFGPGFNFIFAFLLLFFISIAFGSASMDPVISGVEKGYPAAEAGLKKGDRVVSINGHKVSSIDDISLYLTLSDGEKTEIVVEDKSKGNVTYNVTPKVKKNKNNTTYVYGVSLKTEKKYGFVNAVEYTVAKTGSIFKQMFITVAALFTGGIRLSQMSGPVGIYSAVGTSAAAGVSSVLYLMAFLSINVGFINLIPLPAFDGGHILFIVIEKIKGSPVSPRVENTIHTVGLFLLMALMIYITFNDILRIF